MILIKPVSSFCFKNWLFSGFFSSLYKLVLLMVMAYLKSGGLLKLLDDMKCEEKASEDDKKPVLLQIRSIIPVLEEGDLWPNRGFYLKVSDMSHAMYVSLPEDQNEMILSNKLKLGQFIYVQKLEKSEPVPLLRGITPVPGRRQCEGTPQEIISTAKFLKLLQAPEADSIVEKAVISEKKIEASSNNPRKLSRRLSDPHALLKKREGLEERTHGRSRSLSASKARPGEQRIALNCIKKISDAEERNFNVKSRTSSVDNDSDDTDSSTLSSVSSTRTSKRRIWNESEILGVKEIFDSSIVKHEIKPLPRRPCRSATVSPVRSVRYDSSDDNSSSTTKRRNTGAAKKVVKSTNRSKSPTTKIDGVQTSCSTCSLIGEKKGAETGISWGSLPSNLVKLGKEVIRQRDDALLAAADALQEACAAERLLNCLSTFSEFHLADQVDDLQPYVDKFFDLQDDLARTRLIMQSLTKISPLRASETDSSSTSSVKEALTIALERKKNATTWIKSAVAVDLSPCSSTSLNPITTTVAASQAAAKKSGTATRNTKPKGACIVKTHRSSNDIPLVLASDKDEQHEWTRGSNLCAGADLATSLQDECRKLFLSYVEKYLDEVERKSSLLDSDGQIAEMLYKVKKVNDWLDIIVNKEAKYGCKGGSTLDHPELEACTRVRNKIYEILLKHVERTAMALENIST